MAKGNNQKLKLAYLMKILLENTDETYRITMPEIIAALKSYGISAERKSIWISLENRETEYTVIILETGSLSLRS